MTISTLMVVWANTKGYSRLTNDDLLEALLATVTSRYSGERQTRGSMLKHVRNFKVRVREAVQRYYQKERKWEEHLAATQARYDVDGCRKFIRAYNRALKYLTKDTNKTFSQRYLLDLIKVDLIK